MLRDGQRDAGDVGFLERVRANQLAADLTGDADDRHGVHHGRGDAGDHVGRAGAGGGNRDADLSGRAREAIRHVRGALFVPHEDVPDRVVEHRVVRRKNRSSRIAEHARDSLTHQAFPQNLPASPFHIGPLSSYSVTAPSAADDTSFAYFAKTPSLYRAGFGVHLRQPCRDFFRWQRDAQLALRQIERDDVAVAHDRNRPAVRRFRRDVTRHEPARRAREPAVGQQRHRIAEPRAHDRARHRQHLAHARPAARSLVADDDDVARLDRTGLHRRERVFLAVEHARRTGVRRLRVARHLDHRAFGREIALQDDEAAGLLDRIRHRPDDLFLARLLHLREFLRHRLAADADRVAVEEPRVEQALAQQGSAARAIEVGRDVLAARLEVGDQRRPLADAIEILQRQFHTRFACDGEEVEHGVRGSAARRDARDRVFERFAS